MGWEGGRGGSEGGRVALVDVSFDEIKMAKYWYFCFQVGDQKQDIQENGKLKILCYFNSIFGQLLEK